MSLTFLPLTLNRGTTYSTSWRTTRYQGLPAGLRQLLLFSCFRFNARFVTLHTRKHRRAHHTSTKHKRIATLPNMQFDFILTDQGIFKDWKSYPLNGSHQENLPIKDITMLSGYFIHQSYILWIREGESKKTHSKDILYIKRFSRVPTSRSSAWTDTDVVLQQLCGKMLYRDPQIVPGKQDNQNYLHLPLSNQNRSCK
jgi:hypothetical protein